MSIYDVLLYVRMVDMKAYIQNWLLILFLLQYTSTVSAQSFYQEVSFEVEASKMFVEVLINDKPYRFLVDTGASGYGRIDSQLVADLGIPITGTDTNYDGTNTAIIDRVSVDKISFAGITYENVSLLSRDFSRLPNSKRKRNYGLIGQRFWQDYVMEVDYENRKIIFSDIPLSKEDKNTISYSRNFIIPFKVGELDVRGHVDTGSPFTILFPTEYTKEFTVSELREVGTAQSANTIFTCSVGAISDNISIAGHDVSNLTSVFADIGHVNIGMAFLRRYNLKIDQKNHLIQLLKNENLE